MGIGDLDGIGGHFAWILSDVNIVQIEGLHATTIALRIEKKPVVFKNGLVGNPVGSSTVGLDFNHVDLYRKKREFFIRKAPIRQSIIQNLHFTNRRSFILLTNSLPLREHQW